MFDLSELFKSIYVMGQTAATYYKTLVSGGVEINAATHMTEELIKNILNMNIPKIDKEVEED